MLKEDWHFFSDQALDMKIDGKIIQFSCVFTKNSVAGSNRLFTSAGFLLNDKTKIKNAGKITIRVHMSNVPSITWDVPERVLNEWKKLFERAGI